MVTSEKPHVAIVFNPAKTDMERLREAVKMQNAAAGYGEPQWIETDEDDAGARATKRAMESKPAAIMVSGGDGTVRVAAEVMRGSDIPLAIIPQGTGNLMARNIGVPLNDFEQQVRAAYKGDDFRIDLGIAEATRENGETEKGIFLVLAGMGFDARMMNMTNPKMKKSMGWLAYVDAGIREVVADNHFDYQYSLEGKRPRKASAYSVMIGNCGLMPGGMLLIPGAKMDDGKLDTVALRPEKKRGWLSWLSIWNTIGWENGVLRKSAIGRKVIDLVHDARNVDYHTTRELDLRVNEKQPVQLDGDVWGDAVAIKATVDPSALTLKVSSNWKRKI